MLERTQLIDGMYFGSFIFSPPYISVLLIYMTQERLLWCSFFLSLSPGAGWFTGALDRTLVSDSFMAKSLDWIDARCP
jgi:hypothetical protein